MKATIPRLVVTREPGEAAVGRPTSEANVSGRGGAAAILSTIFVVSNRNEDAQLHCREGAASVHAASILAELIKYRSPTLNSWLSPVARFAEDEDDAADFGPRARSGVLMNRRCFKIPTFSERYSGWEDDREDGVASHMVAAAGFFAKSMNAGRLARALLDSLDAAVLQDSAGALDDLVDLCVAVQRLVATLEMTAHPRPAEVFSSKEGASEAPWFALWYEIANSVNAIADWWKSQIRNGHYASEAAEVQAEKEEEPEPEESASRSPPSSPKPLASREQCVYLPAMGKLNRAVLMRPSRPRRSPLGHTWAIISLLAGALLSETARLLAAAGAMASAYVLRRSPPESEEIRNAWRNCWDANMIVFRGIVTKGSTSRLPASGAALLTSTGGCQYLGQGRMPGGGDVLMPVLNGALGKALGEGVQRYREWQQKGAIQPEPGALSDAAGVPDTDLALRVRTVTDQFAWEYSFMVFAMFNHVTAFSRTQLKMPIYYVPARWDWVTAASTLRYGIPHADKPCKRNPMRITLQVNAEMRASADSSFSAGTVSLCDHTVEVVRRFEADGREMHYKTALANPATWGPFGMLF